MAVAVTVVPRTPCGHEPGARPVVTAGRRDRHIWPARADDSTGRQLGSRSGGPRNRRQQPTRRLRAGAACLPAAHQDHRGLPPQPGRPPIADGPRPGAGRADHDQIRRRNGDPHHPTSYEPLPGSPPARLAAHPSRHQAGQAANATGRHPPPSS